MTHLLKTCGLVMLERVRQTRGRVWKTNSLRFDMLEHVLYRKTAHTFAGYALASALSFGSLTLAQAEDTMKKTDTMQTDTMKKETMKKETMKPGTTKDHSMHSDGMSKDMQHDDKMMKNDK